MSEDDESNERIDLDNYAEPRIIKHSGTEGNQEQR